MSYSFGVRAASVAALAVAARSELAKVAELQPIHARDQEATSAAIDGLLALVEAPAAHEELTASIAGSCYGDEGKAFRGVTLSIHITTVGKSTE